MTKHCCVFFGSQCSRLEGDKPELDMDRVHSWVGSGHKFPDMHGSSRVGFTAQIFLKFQFIRVLADQPIGECAWQYRIYYHL